MRLGSLSHVGTTENLGNIKSLLRDYLDFASRKGYSAALAHLSWSLHGHLDSAYRPDLYDIWIAENRLYENQVRRMRRKCRSFSYRPKISVLVPVHDPPAELFHKTADCVLNQIYDRWELCIADDASTDKDTLAVLDRLEDANRNIRITRLKRNRGISGATNAALELATGDFVALLDHDDMITPDALFWVADALNTSPGLDMIYSDEDKIDTGGNRRDPFFKPDWSPDLILSMMYTCHLGVYRTSLVRQLGGFRSDLDGSQDHDLVLRLSERTDRIHHIPKVLYHWRMSSGSGASHIDAKPWAVEAGRKALEDALSRRGIDGRALHDRHPGRYQIEYEISGNPQIDIIMPTGGRIDLLDPCIRSIVEKTTYPCYTIYLVDNSRDAQVRKWMEGLPRDVLSRIRYLRCDHKPFNFPLLINHGMEQTSARYVLILNDDMTIITRDWLEQMLQHAQRKEVGAVGCKLLYPPPRNQYQHAGVIMGPYGNTGHVQKYLPAESTGYFSLPAVIRNCSAVTGACMMYRREVYQEVGGMDEKYLPLAFNDVDLCLEMRSRGYLVVYTPYAELYHHESVTKDSHANAGEEQHMKSKWAHIIAHDPYYNPNLTREREDYSIGVNLNPFKKIIKTGTEDTPMMDI